MNLQSTHHLKGGKKIKRTVIARSSRGRSNNLKLFLPPILLLMLVFAIAASSARFNSETEELSREASRLERQIHRQNRYIANAKVRIASLKGNVIFRQLKRFKLDLHNPAAGQIRKLQVASAMPESDRRYPIKEAKLLVSRR